MVRNVRSVTLAVLTSLLVLAAMSVLKWIEAKLWARSTILQVHGSLAHR